MLSKVSALHPSHRRERYSVAYIPNGPDAGDITLAEVIHLDAALIIQLNPNLQKAVDSACPYSL